MNENEIASKLHELTEKSESVSYTFMDIADAIKRLKVYR